MIMKPSYLPLLAALAEIIAAKTIVIDVGKSGLTFDPSSGTAAVGDVLEFHFFGSFHTVVQSDFSSPCQQSSSGFNSGDIDNTSDGSGSVFQVTVKDTDPIWYFCGTPGHCQAGMAGVINPPSSGDSLTSYISAAAGTTSKSGDSAEGGVVAPVPSGGASSSTASTTSSTSAASTSVDTSSSIAVSSTVSSGPSASAKTTPSSSSTGTLSSLPTLASPSSSSSPSPAGNDGALSADKFGILGVVAAGLTGLFGVL